MFGGGMGREKKKKRKPQEDDRDGLCFAVSFSVTVLLRLWDIHLLMEMLKCQVFFDFLFFFQKFQIKVKKIHYENKSSILLFQREAQDFKIIDFKETSEFP